jgi:hypothetical protein
MLADQLKFDSSKKDHNQAQLVAHLTELYKATSRSKHPHAREMARRYEQELRQLAGGSSLAVM